MTSEHEFITKTYYQTFISENDTRHPVEILGEAYMAEQEKELYDLSYIRFAQGEIYFHYKDFEAAIYKWENISNDLEPWAKKNIADAYYELGLLSNVKMPIVCGNDKRGFSIRCGVRPESNSLPEH